MLDVLVKLELVVFDRQQVVPSALQHDLASRFGLGVQGIQRDESALEVQVGKEPAGQRFVDDGDRRAVGAEVGGNGKSMGEKWR